MKEKNSPERGGCLTIFLLVLVVFTVYGLWGAFGTKQVYQDLAAQGLIPEVLIPDWVLPAQIALAALSLVFIYGIFTWKKWGVYGLVAAWIAGIVIGMATPGTILPLSLLILGVEVLLLATALRGRWMYFE
jgi:hypothetical protein